MSIDATRWAWQQSLRPSHKLVLLSLADRAGENNDCYPSIIRLSKDTGLDRKTIMVAIDQLVSLKIIQTSKTDGKSNIYKLIGVENRTDTRPVPKTGLPVIERNAIQPNAVADQSQKRTSTKIGSTKNGIPPVPKTGLEPVPLLDFPLLEPISESISESKTFTRQGAKVFW